MSNQPNQDTVLREIRVKARAKKRSETEGSTDAMTQPLSLPIEGVRVPISDLSPKGVEELPVRTNEVDGDTPNKALHANELEGIPVTRPLTGCSSLGT